MESQSRKNVSDPSRRTDENARCSRDARRRTCALPENRAGESRKFVSTLLRCVDENAWCSRDARRRTCALPENRKAANGQSR